MTRSGSYIESATACRPSAAVSPGRRRPGSACRTPGGITASAGAWCGADPVTAVGRLRFRFEARRSESVNDDTQPVHEVGFTFTSRF